MYDYNNIAKDYSNIRFVAEKDYSWCKKDDVYKPIGKAIALGHWTDDDDADSHVWKNERNGTVEYDERIWNSGLKMIKL